MDEVDDAEVPRTKGGGGGVLRDVAEAMEATSSRGVSSGGADPRTERLGAGELGRG